MLGLVQHASVRSMGVAVKDVDVAVPRQTVNNKVLALKEVVVNVALATVTEGIEATTKWHRTVNAIYFEGYGI